MYQRKRPNKRPRYGDHVELDRGLHNHRCAQPPPDLQGSGYYKSGKFYINMTFASSNCQI